MEERKNGKVLAIVALLVAVAGLSLGYAALSTTLTINGSASIENSSWDIHFANASAASPTSVLTPVTASGTALTFDGTTKIQSFTVTLKAPGDTVTYTFDIVNAGSYAAKIGTFTKAAIATTNCSGTGVTETDKTNVCGKTTYTLKYANDDPVAADRGHDVAANDTIAVGQTRKVVLTVSFDAGNTILTDAELPKHDVTVTLPEITMIYVQA